MRSLAFLSILRGVLPLSLTSGPLNFYRATIVYSQTPSLGVRADICPAVSVQYFRTSERWRFSCADQMSWIYGGEDHLREALPKIEGLRGRGPDPVALYFPSPNTPL